MSISTQLKCENNNILKKQNHFYLLFDGSEYDYCDNIWKIVDGTCLIFMNLMSLYDFFEFA